MDLMFAPRIDPRVRLYIVRSDKHSSAAEVTRGAGELAWRLGLRRPSYQQVRVLRSPARLDPIRPRGTRTLDAKVIFETLERVHMWVADYPGLGLGVRYRRQYHPRT